MTSKKSIPTTKPQAANKTSKRDNQARSDKEPTAKKNIEEDDAETTDDDADAADGDEAGAEPGAASRSSEGHDAIESKQNSGSSSLIMQLVSSFVGNNLQDAIASVKSKVTEQMEVHGPEYLDSAKTHLIEATEKVTAWGKKHPVQAVAAATALIGVSAFLYATLRDKSDQESQKGGAKGQA